MSTAVESHVAAEAAGPAAAEHQSASASWWWDYAEMKAPDHDEMYYFKFSLLCVAYWFAVHLIIHLIAMNKAQVYRDMDRVKRTEYRTYWCSPLHSFVCVVLSTIAMFFICGDGKTVFNNDSCMNTVRYVHIWALLHTCGYFMVDFFFLCFVIGGRTALDYQTYAHHLIATFTFYQTLYFMDFMVVFGVMLLFMEVSTTYVSFRWLLYTHKMQESGWYAVNALLAFFSFLIGRLVYQVYIVFWVGAGWVYEEYEKKNLTVYQGTVVTEMAIMVILSIVLNVYWMWLMIKMIGRVIQRARAAKADPIEKVELVKADALAEDNCGNSTQGSNHGDAIAEESQNDVEINTIRLEELGMDI